ncbi:MAG: hypothetical protein V9E81_09105 [Marmoricola sp.]
MDCDAGLHAPFADPSGFYYLLKQIQPISTALDVPHRIDRH